MLIHYIKIAFRNLLKYKTQNLIAILGVTIGLVSFTFGYQWLKYETSYDAFYPQSDYLYMIVGTEVQTGKQINKLPLPLLDEVKQNFPESAGATALFPNYGSPFKEGEREFGYPEVKFVDDNFFRYFTPALVCGRIDNWPVAKEEIVVSRSFAQKHWDTAEKALGVVLQSGYDDELRIVAVVEDYPRNSIFHKAEVFQKDWLTSRGAEYRQAELRWKQEEISLVVCLRKQASANEFNAKLENYLIEHKYNDALKLNIIPLTRVRHSFGKEFGIEGTYSLNYIYLFTVTTLILLICVFLNYINMFVNRIYQRTKEMKLRHAVGAGKPSLVVQLVAELVVQFILILLLSCCVIEIAAPWFSDIFEIDINTNQLWPLFFIVSALSFLVLLLLCLPLLMFYIRHSALQVFGGLQAHHSTFVRKLTMSFQVGICVAFMFCAIGVGKQVACLMHNDLGFKKEGLVQYIMDYMEREAIARDIATIPMIQEFTSAGIFMFSHEPQTINIVEWEGKQPDYKPNFELISTDYKFLTTLKIPLLEGEDFKETDDIGWSNRNKKALLNKEAVRIIGIEDIVGKKIRVWDYSTRQDGSYGMYDVEVVGVYKGFQSTDLRNPIHPQILLHNSNRYSAYSFYARVLDGQEDKVIPLIEEAFRKHATPHDPDPRIASVTEVFSNLHKSENASFQLFLLLAGLSVLISLFGIYSISYSNMERRQREVALRKIMGGSTQSIAGMFICEYMLIALAANLVFLPLAWLFVNGWIQQFSNQYASGLIEVVCVVLVSVLFIVLTVLGHVLRTVRMNPAEVIKRD